MLENHLAGQKAHRELYYAHRYISEEYPEKMVTIIHDKMDHSKTTSPHFSHKSKATEAFMKLPVAITGMIAHGHGDVRYAYYGLDIYPMNPNHTIGSIAKLLRDLEGVRRNASRCMFTEEGEQSTLTKALFERSGDMQVVVVAYSGRAGRCETITTNSDITIGQCVCGQ